MAPIPRNNLIAAINAPFAARSPLIRMVPVGVSLLAGPDATKYATCILSPSASVALAIRTIVFSPSVLVPHYFRMLAKKDIDDIVAGTWVADNTDGALTARFALQMQATNRTDQTAKSTVLGGVTPLAPNRLGAIYRQNTGAGGAGEPARHTVEFPWPVILWGDDAGGIPGLIVQSAAANTTIRMTFYGDEWPLDTDPALYK